MFLSQKFFKQTLNAAAIIVFVIVGPFAMAKPKVWPNNYVAAISLTFDDARPSQADVAIPFLNKMGVKGTFYLQTNQAGHRLNQWQEAANSGHEIGSHTHNHPCSGNFYWSRENALENYDLKTMSLNLKASIDWIKNKIGVTPKSFAYPCGETFVGRGKSTRSYVPLIANHFMTGRAAYNEAPNDPTYADFSQLFSLNLDQATMAQLLPLIEEAIKTNGWIIYMAHDVGSISSPKKQTAYLETMQEIIEFSRSSEHPIWVAPVGTIAEYLHNTRQ